MFISSNYLSKPKVDILLRVLQMFTPNDSEEKHNPSQTLMSLFAIYGCRHVTQAQLRKKICKVMYYDGVTYCTVIPQQGVLYRDGVWLCRVKP